MTRKTTNRKKTGKPTGKQTKKVTARDRQTVAKAAKAGPPQRAKDARGHIQGSRKGKVHAAFDKDGPEAATKKGLALGLKESTLRSWLGAWQRAASTSKPKSAGRVSKAGNGKAKSATPNGAGDELPTATA